VYHSGRNVGIDSVSIEANRKRYFSRSLAAGLGGDDDDNESAEVLNKQKEFLLDDVDNNADAFDDKQFWMLSDDGQDDQDALDFNDFSDDEFKLDMLSESENENEIERDTKEKQDSIELLFRDIMMTPSDGDGSGNTLAMRHDSNAARSVKHFPATVANLAARGDGDGILAAIEALVVDNEQRRLIDDDNDITFACTRGMAALSRCRGFELRVFEVLGLMARHDVPRDIVAYQTLMTACAQAKSVEQAFRVIELASADGIEPDVAIFTSLIKVCHAAGLNERAWQVFDTMRLDASRQPDQVTYGLMMSVCAAQGRVERAFNFLDEMRLDGLEPKLSTFNALIKACAHRPDHYEQAFGVIDEMRAAGFMPDAYTMSSLVHAAARNGDIDTVRRLIVKLDETGEVSIDVLVTALAVYGRAMRHAKTTTARLANIADAETLFERIVTRWRAEYGDGGESARRLNAAMHNTMLSVYTEGGRSVDRALEFAADMERKGIVNKYSCTTLLKMFVNVNRPTAAVDVFENMRVRGIEPDGIAYRYVIYGCARVGWTKSALTYLESMLRDGVAILPKHTRYLAHRSKDFPHVLDKISEILTRAGIAPLELRSYLKYSNPEAALYSKQKGGERGALKIALARSGLSIEDTHDHHPDIYRWNRPANRPNNAAKRKKRW
jgi:pentatricopeptide repeat protein